MEITRDAKPIRRIADVSMWHCAGCEAVHLSVGKMTLSFTRSEFAGFVDAVVDIHTSGWDGGPGAYSLLELAAPYSDATIH